MQPMVHGASRSRRTSSAGDAPPRLSKARLWLFRLGAAGSPLLVLLLAEMVFRLVPGLNEDRDPYVNISPMSVFSRTWVAGEEYYTITHRWVLGGGSVSIRVNKPANTVRIFCVGSSACAGWPHPPAETFSAYLQQALENAYPGKKIEVVNVAGHGFAAYRDRHVVDEVSQMQPDAVIVWEGNNEFLEDRNYDPPSASVVALGRRLRTVQWLESKLTSRPELDGGDIKGAAQFFWTKVRQQSLRLREDPVQFEQVQRHFRESFDHMVRQSQRRKIPLILCTVPVNMRDWLPTVSHNRLAGEQRQQWQKLYNQARRCLLNGRPKDGIPAIQQALVMENEHAESYFWLGRLLEADGQKAAAWQAFGKARDQDYNPFRALGSFNETIRSLASANQGKGVYLLDLEQLFAGATRYAAPGFDLFLDYVHPTKPANLLVAQNVYDLLLGEVLQKPETGTKRFTYRDPPSEPNETPYRDETDVHLLHSRLNVAALNHQYEAIVRQTEILVLATTGQQLKGPDDPALSRCSRSPQIAEQIAEQYRAVLSYLEVQRRVILDEPVSAEEEQESARRLDAYYAKWYPYGRF